MIETKAMKTVCAWCQRHLSGHPEAKDVSHGICPECYKKYFPKKCARCGLPKPEMSADKGEGVCQD